jgi:hypothetical protein
VAEGKLTHDGARAVLAVAFPQLDSHLVEAMVGGVLMRTVDAVSNPLGLPAPASDPPAGAAAIEGLPAEASAGADGALSAPSEATHQPEDSPPGDGEQPTDSQEEQT